MGWTDFTLKSYSEIEPGVNLTTVDRGFIDPDDLASWITSAVDQYSANKFLKDLAQNITRGKYQRAKEGKRMGGFPPFGYKAEHNERGDFVRLVPDPEKAPYQMDV